MRYMSPGNADVLSDGLLSAWNATIDQAYLDSRNDLKSRFFTLEHSDISNPIEAKVQWFADPAEPTFCLNEEWGRKLSDWGIRGRHALHNEYCEYTIQYGVDANGRVRPKRVQFSTELREYWVCIAREDPDKLQEIAHSILGFEPRFEDLYGTADPHGLSPAVREASFSALVAGYGKFRPPQAGPSQPTGPLNRDHMLFMSHPINGLDDLLYIVLFGARPYATEVNGVRFPASKEQMFRFDDAIQLACRHADPAAAVGAHAAAYEGRTIAFADPLGMYIRTFNKSDILFEGNPAPDEWVRLSRGDGAGRYQRLEVGAPDSEDVFLDDFAIVQGSTVDAISGGYQIARKIEVGPIILASEKSTVADSEYVMLTESDALIDCATASVCSRTIQPLKMSYENEQGPSLARSPRSMS